MIGVSYKGRLGNQLFQLVFFQYLRSQKNSSVIFLHNAHHANVTKYFEFSPELSYTGSRWYSTLGRAVTKIFSFKDIYIHNFVSPKEIVPKDHTLYHGYFQTDYYLKKISLDIKVKDFYSKKFNADFGEVFNGEKKVVVVHIRRTDYLNYGKRDISLPISFFKQQLNLIPDLDNYKVIFVSDDMEFVKKEFPEKPNYIFSSNDEITDFQIIQNADIAIISNSTFAWWASYLSPKKNLVIAPKNWVGFRIGREHPRGIMTTKFNWVDVPVD